jgi:hypoxanthine phosphoribosyltransferase
MKMLAVSWEDVQSHLLALSEKIERDGYAPDMIVGVARGGWVAARLLSDMLGVSDLATMKIAFYKGIDETEKRPTITQPVSESPRARSPYRR